MTTASASSGGAAGGAGGTNTTTASTTSSGGNGGGAGGGDGGSAMAPCGGVAALVDTFDDDSLSPHWQSSDGGGATIKESQGRLSLTVAPTNLTYAQVGSQYAYNFTNRSVSVEVVSVPLEPAKIRAGLFVFAADANDNLEMGIHDNKLFWGYRYGAITTSLGSTDYDAVTHRWWRIRTDATYAYFDVSADGDNWTALAQVPLTKIMPLQYVRTAMAIQRIDVGSSDDGVAFDNYNTQEVTEPYCPSSSFSDDFDAAMLGPGWYGWNVPGCSGSFTDGHYQLDIMANTAAYCGIRTAAAYDLTLDRLSVQVPVGHDSGVGRTAQLTATSADGDFVTLAHVGPTLSFSYVSQANYYFVDSTNYDPVLHKYWSLREAAGMLYFETSSNGKSWVTRGSIPTPFAMDTIQVSLEGGTEANAEPTRIAFDDYNL